MRSSTPTVHCDTDEGDCGAWDVDFYATGASSVGGMRVTADRPAPGWTSSDGEDRCPTHSTPDHA